MPIRGLTGWLGTVLGTPEPRALAEFYQALLGGVLHVESDSWVTLHLGDSTHTFGFQLETDHIPAVWPQAANSQQMQVHVDIGVSALPEAVGDAEALGATRATTQPQDDVVVMLDPAGHPFCLYVDDVPVEPQETPRIGAL